ncbi:pectin acetylesterase 7-like isoform X2 [Nicotiana sylvestris]|uniref:pectin acetylesterase 7-like isoform X2 n=1 Tax=Nicotiana sylvestris TaxID=4096 RepID=UPI00388C50BE
MLCQKEQYVWMDHLQHTILNLDLAKELEIGLYNFREEHGAQTSQNARIVFWTRTWVLQILRIHGRFKEFIARIRLQIQVLVDFLFFYVKYADFYNWNKVFVRYCDGGAFTGDVEYVDHVTNLHFRGARIFEAVMEDLLAKGLKNAKNAILAGSSAGGYPTMLYCDHFRSLLPNTPRVKCLVDSGYFIHVKNPMQASGFEKIYNSLLTLHGSTKALPKSCTSKMNPPLCFFPENMQQHIKTPLFIAMSAFDYYQIKTTIDPNADRCVENRTCTECQNKAFRGN